MDITTVIMICLVVGVGSFIGGLEISNYFWKIDLERGQKKSNVRDEKNDHVLITISVPNRDSYPEPYTMIPKEVLQKAYMDKIGEFIDFCGTQKKVRDVTVTDKFIFIDLE